MQHDGCTWLGSWFELLGLATDAQEVIGLRMLKLASGGTAAYGEAFLMVTEKVGTGAYAAAALAAGVSADRIVAVYRQEVRANAVRLSGRG